LIEKNPQKEKEIREEKRREEQNRTIETAKTIKHNSTHPNLEPLQNPNSTSPLIQISPENATPYLLLTTHSSPYLPNQNQTILPKSSEKSIEI